MKKILLTGKKIDRDEQKKIKGGEEIPSVYVCGHRWSNNQCYCDWCYQSNNQVYECDDPCNSYFCGY